MSASSNSRKRVGRRTGSWRSGVFLLLLTFLGISGVAQPRPSPWDGRDLFQTKGCIHCHSIHGEGGEIGPDLGQRNFYGTYLELGARMWNHFPDMSAKMRQVGEPLPRFSPKEMSQLVSYLSYLRYMGVSGSERRGRRLLQIKGCVSCHRFGGVGGSSGPDLIATDEYLSPLRLAESMWNHGPKLVAEMEQRGIERPEFYGNEFMDLAAGVRSFMRPTRVPAGSFDLGNPVLGAGLVETKDCLKCHDSQPGRGSAPGFEAMDLDYSVTELAGKMWNHGPAMWQSMKDQRIDFPIFAAGEMANILAYLYGLKLEDDRGVAARGERLVEQKDCVLCHSAARRTETGAPDLANLGHVDSPEALIAKMWNHAPKMHQRSREQRLLWPRLEGRDMADLYAYLRSR